MSDETNVRPYLIAAALIAGVAGAIVVRALAVLIWWMVPKRRSDSTTNGDPT